MRSFSRRFTRQAAAAHAKDFSHHQPGIARLNHGSFGAAPLPVIRVEDAHRLQWRSNPDACYFGEGAASLDTMLASAANDAAGELSAAPGSVALVENATVATSIIAIAATAFTVQSDGGVTGVKLDKNYSDTTAATVTGLNIDFDKTGTSTSNNTMYGIKLDMDNTTATNGNNYMYGLHVTPTLTHAADASYI